jgi:hypothetical protein
VLFRSEGGEGERGRAVYTIKVEKILKKEKEMDMLP